LPYCDEIIKTTVHGEFDGDTYFPDVDLEQFTKVSESFYEKDDKNAYDFTITVFEK
jgi:dihydrofolate reductase